MVRQMMKREIGNICEYDYYNIELFCSEKLICKLICFMYFFTFFSVHSTKGINLEDTIFMYIGSSDHINVPSHSWYNDKTFLNNLRKSHND